MDPDVVEVAVSFVVFGAVWAFIAWDRPRVLARRPERTARVEQTSLWVLRAVAFGPFVLPFYLGRTRGWRGACVGVIVFGALLGVLAALSVP